MLCGKVERWKVGCALWPCALEGRRMPFQSFSSFLFIYCPYLHYIRDILPALFLLTARCSCPSPWILSSLDSLAASLRYRYRRAITRLPLHILLRAPPPWRQRRLRPQGSESPPPVLPFRPFKALLALASLDPNISVPLRVSDRVTSRQSSRAFPSICEKRKSTALKYRSTRANSCVQMEKIRTIAHPPAISRSLTDP